MMRIKFIQYLTATYALLFSVTSVVGCCSDIQLPASVQPDLLYQALIPEVETLSHIFPREFLDQLQPTEIHVFEDFIFVEIPSTLPYDFVYVSIDLLGSEDDSMKLFQEMCHDNIDFQHPDAFTYVGSEGNQYCVSYVNQAREGQEALCKPYERYYTKVIFQKGRIIFYFRESSPDSRNNQMNKMIMLFAAQLNKSLKP